MAGATLKPTHLSLEEWCVRTGACARESRRWLLARSTAPLTEAEVIDRADPSWARFLCRGYGNGDGYGNGYGDGDGNGYGYGDGDSYGYGDGYGYGYGDGDGDGYGDGDGDGNGGQDP